MGKLDIETRGHNLTPNRVVNARIKANKCANDPPLELTVMNLMCFQMENKSVLSGLGIGHQNEKMLKWKSAKSTPNISFPFSKQ